jgi:hypothetical protein
MVPLKRTICDQTVRYYQLMHSSSTLRILCGTAALLLCGPALIRASEGPYFVTYTHQLEEQGNLDVENRSVIGRPAATNRFIGSAVELNTA